MRIIKIHLLKILLFCILALALLIINTFALESSELPELTELKFRINEPYFLSNFLQKELDVAPQIVDGRSLVPFRVLFEELGYTIEWDDATKKITCDKNNFVIELWIGKNIATINGTEVTLAVPPQIINGRTLVPLRFVSENSGAYCVWNDEEKSVQVVRINTIPKEATYSPSGSYNLFKNLNGQFFISDEDNNITNYLGIANSVEWLDDETLFIKTDKMYLSTLDGTKSEVDTEWKYGGKSFSGDNFYISGTKVYTELDESSSPIKSFDKNITNIISFSSKNNFLVSAADTDELLFYKTLSSQPETLGRPSLLINSNGEVGNKLFGSTIAYNETGSYLAFLQSENNKTNVYVKDLTLPTKALVASIGYTVSPTMQKNPIILRWLDNTTLKVENDTLAWTIKVGNTLEITETIDSLKGANFGSALLYTKDSDNQNKFLFVNGQTSKTIPMENKEVQNWYSFNKKAFATILDKTSNKLSFVVFENDGFKVLLNDFNIEETFEYSNNFIIHGYDRIQKINKLLRYDGTQLFLIGEDYYIGKHIEYNSKLILNKYDKNRHYTLLSFNKNSSAPWNAEIISEGFIVDNYYTLGTTRLCLLGTWEEGGKSSIVEYDEAAGNLVVYISHNKIFTADNLFDFKGNLFGIANKTLYYIGPRKALPERLLDLNDPLESRNNIVYVSKIDFCYKIGFAETWDTSYVPIDATNIQIKDENEHITKAKLELTKLINTEITATNDSLKAIADQKKAAAAAVDEANAKFAAAILAHNKEVATEEGETATPISADVIAATAEVETALLAVESIATSTKEYLNTLTLQLETLNNKLTALDNLRLLPVITTFSVFKDKLYLCTTDRKAVFTYQSKTLSYDGKIFTAWNEEVLVSFASNQLCTLNNTYNVLTTVNPQFNWESYITTKDWLYLLGKDDSADQDPLLLITAGNQSYIPVRDVTLINKMQIVNNKVFLDIHDYDRIAKKQRDSVVLLEDNQIRNIVLGHNTTNWDEINGRFFLSLKEIDVNVEKLSVYDDRFTLIANNFETTFWQKFSNTLYICGMDNSIKKTTFLKYKDIKKEIISSTLNVTKLVELDNDYLLVYGTDLDQKSPTLSQNNLYLYNGKNNSLTPINKNIEIVKMLMLSGSSN